ncbi:hypothetical protein TNIN_73751 [Trichonephila inaurata madagascariensis]|uniref:Uncharacterized protein n=1 Tax=Trichonephila inaurata madagascariensis TaxID=2747483 RepID=A0A8X7BR56_9ARAC|nr:hypothetical protein TNIN_73751 [Trichonephila inaurata madagascariensis]
MIPSDHRMISFEMKIPKSDRACDCSVKQISSILKKELIEYVYSQYPAENATLDFLASCMQPDSPFELCSKMCKNSITTALKNQMPLKKRVVIIKVPWWIEASSSNFTSSFEDTIDAVLRKSFPLIRLVMIILNIGFAFRC